MAVAKDAISTYGSGSKGTVHEFSATSSVSLASGMTVGGSATALLALFVTSNGTLLTFSTKTWGGVTADYAQHAINVGNNQVWIFGWSGTPTGTQTLALNWGSSSDGYITAISFTGSKTASAFANTNTNSGTLTNPSVAITCAAGDAVIGCFESASPASATSDTEIDIDTNLTPNGAFNYALIASGTSHTLSITAASSAASVVGVDLQVATSSAKTNFLPLLGVGGLLGGARLLERNPPLTRRRILTLGR